MSRVWTRERAHREGVSVARLTGGVEFVRVVPGAYVEACWADDLPTRCAAVLTRAPHAVLSHWTSMQVQGLPAPVRRSGAPAAGRWRAAIHVTVLDGRPTPRWSGVVVHRARSIWVAESRGLRLTGPERAWCDAAALVSGRAGGDEADLVAAGDALLARRPAAADRIVELAAERGGRRGVALAGRVLPLLDPRSESAMESRLRYELHCRGLPAPAVQHEVRDGRGTFVARVDLAHPEARVAVEYDGDHHRDPSQWRRDLRRRERLDALGWRVVVITANDLLHDPAVVVARVRRAVTRAAA